MAKVIAIANQKGGVAKTTTSGAMAASLKRRGFKVLAVDLDPQGNLSDGVGADNETQNTIYELLKGETNDVVQSLDAFDIIPSNIMLASADIEFTQTGKEYRLKEALAEIEKKYDYVILDTPPSLGILTVNAFTYANEVIIPTSAGIFAVSGIVQLYSSIETVRKYCNQSLKIAGILLTRYNPRAIINKDIKEITEQLADRIHAKVFNTFIRTSVVVEEAQANHIDLYSYNEKNSVTKDYEAFVTEYLEGENNE